MVSAQAELRMGVHGLQHLDTVVGVENAMSDMPLSVTESCKRAASAQIYESYSAYTTCSTLTRVYLFKGHQREHRARKRERVSVLQYLETVVVDERETSSNSGRKASDRK